MHLDHAFTYIFFDVLVRYLICKGYMDDDLDTPGSLRLLKDKPYKELLEILGFKFQD